MAKEIRRQVVARINTTAVDREGDVVLPTGAARCGPNSCTARRRSRITRPLARGFDDFDNKA